MAKSLKEARAAYRADLAKMAAEESDEGKEAAAALAEYDEAEDKKAKKAEAEKEAAKAADDAPPDSERRQPAAAAAEPEEDKEEAKKAAALARAEAQAMSLAHRVQALEAERAAEKIAHERASLLAKRPDFDKEIRASLATAPLALVREAVEKWPRIANAHEAAVAALTPGAVQGADGSSIPPLSAADAEFIARKMSLGNEEGGITRNRNELTLGYMSKGAAVALARKLNGTEAK